MNQYQKSKIVVLGGAVMDLVFPVRELPQWRQAVQAHTFNMYPGGKGLNQAIAASRLGADVSLISAVGADEFGERIIDYLKLHRIVHDFVQIVKGGYTDVTGVFVNEQGEPAFVGWKGLLASQISNEDVEKAAEEVKNANAIMITFEVPLDAIEKAINIARSNGILIILTPAPPLDLLEPPPYASLEYVDVIVPNLWEACQLLRKDGEPKDLALQMHGMGVKIACVTNSEYGYAIATKGHVLEYPSFLVGKPVDITGGSDAFCAALCISLINKVDLDEAIKIANAAAAISMTKRGGAPSMPSLVEVGRFLKLRGITARLFSE